MEEKRFWKIRTTVALALYLTIFSSVFGAASSVDVVVTKCVQSPNFDTNSNDNETCKNLYDKNISTCVVTNNKFTGNTSVKGIMPRPFLRLDLARLYQLRVVTLHFGQASKFLHTSILTSYSLHTGQTEAARLFWDNKVREWTFEADVISPGKGITIDSGQPRAMKQFFRVEFNTLQAALVPVLCEVSFTARGSTAVPQFALICIILLASLSGYFF